MTETTDDLARIARDLTEIEDLATHLAAEALHRSNSRLMPGGGALVASAPDADLGEWSEQIAYAELRHYAACLKVNHKECAIADHVNDEDDQWTEDPLRTLLFWTDEWRRDVGMTIPAPNLHTEVNFLRQMLDWAWNNEPHFADLVRDVNYARRRLEDLLHAGRRPQRSRVLCPHCDKATRLVKSYAPARVAGYRCRACGHAGIISPDATHCGNPWCWSVVEPEPIMVSHSRDDRWKCPTCKRKFDQGDYEEAYGTQLRSEGAQRFIPIRDAVAILRAQGRPERTVRQWIAEEDVAIDDSTGVRRVWWPDLWTLHRTKATRKRTA